MENRAYVRRKCISDFNVKKSIWSLVKKKYAPDVSKETSGTYFFALGKKYSAHFVWLLKNRGTRKRKQVHIIIAKRDRQVWYGEKL